MLRNKFMKPILLVALSFSLLLVIGCGPRERRTLGGEKIAKRGMISKEELRDLLNIYRDYFISQMKQTANQLDEDTSSRRVERTNLQMRTKIIGAVDAMLEPNDPVEAFLEVWGFTIRMRIYLTEGEGRNLYREHQSTVIDFIKDNSHS